MRAFKPSDGRNQSRRLHGTERDRKRKGRFKVPPRSFRGPKQKLTNIPDADEQFKARWRLMEKELGLPPPKTAESFARPTACTAPKKESSASSVNTAPAEQHRILAGYVPNNKQIASRFLQMIKVINACNLLSPTELSTLKQKAEQQMRQSYTFRITNDFLRMHEVTKEAVQILEDRMRHYAQKFIKLSHKIKESMGPGDFDALLKKASSIIGGEQNPLQVFDVADWNCMREAVEKAEDRYERELEKNLGIATFFCRATTRMLLVDKYQAIHSWAYRQLLESAKEVVDARGRVSSKVAGDWNEIKELIEIVSKNAKEQQEATLST